MQVEVGNTKLLLGPNESSMLAEVLGQWKEEHYTTYDPTSEFISRLLSEIS